MLSKIKADFKYKVTDSQSGEEKDTERWTTLWIVSNSQQELEENLSKSMLAEFKAIENEERFVKHVSARTEELERIA